MTFHHHNKVSARALACTLACALVLVLLPRDEARALPNEDLVCSPDDVEMDRYAYLRALSLHLRGTVPNAGEFKTLDNEEDVPDLVIDAWLNSEDFADQVVRHHRSLLWNNVSGNNLFRASNSLGRQGGTLLYWRRQTATMYRGDAVPCLDEPAQWDEYGNLVVTEQADGTWLEGYVLVNPHWNPNALLKVCGFDAQDNLTGLTGIGCGSRSSTSDPSCGCGPELRWCRYGGSHLPVTDVLGADVDERVRAMILAEEPYTALFSSQRAYVNGPLIYYLKHQTELFAGIRFDPLPVNIDSLPELDWTDQELVEIQLGAEHAGVLSSPAFLIRFQTNRSRANRFYDAFLCQPFQAPAEGLPVDEEKIPDPDLQKRDGCKYCHALLEPSAAYWGRWTEGGPGYIAPDVFPKTRADCTACALSNEQCDSDCNRFYLTDALSVEETPFLGALKPYVFRKPEHDVHVEAGPELLVTEAVIDGRLPRCVTQRTSEWLLGRPLGEREEPWLTEMAATFVSSGFDYKALVKAIVTSDTYRRVE